jgi:hypothetical protein
MSDSAASRRGDLTTTPFDPTRAEEYMHVSTLAESRRLMTEMDPDPDIEGSILGIVDRWHADSKEVNPIEEMQGVLESIRQLPSGYLRVCRMNTFVRTLGRRDVLATYLEMMLDSAEREGTEESALCKASQDARMHAIYGWSGQTLLLKSKAGACDGTFPPMNGVAELTGNKSSQWGVSIHVWQPNTKAKGFPSPGVYSSEVFVEPPHSHPFEFVSMVTVGNIHQSIYSQQRAKQSGPGRYDGRVLEHVDCVWPPHTNRTASEVITLEDRLELREGDSYYMPCNWIHDVEVDIEASKKRPAITLFLSTEFIVKPHVYLPKQLADYHDANPLLHTKAAALSVDKWKAKMKMLSLYIGGEIPLLELAELIEYQDEYAFFLRHP